MNATINRRDLLTAGAGLGVVIQLGAGSALAQGRGAVPNKTAKTTKLFKAPGMYPNGIAVAPEGLWIAQQKLSPQQAKFWNKPVPTDRDEAAWLVDWNGKLLKTLTTHSRNTSGMAYGDGCVWMGANADPEGVFQVDMNSKELSHRQIPLSLDGNGGGCHGLQWHEGKLWIAALRLGGVLRVDPKTWAAEALLLTRSDTKPRMHDLTFDNEGNLWQVTGNDSNGYAEGKPGLSKYDGKTGRLLMTVDFAPGSCDPHGLEFHDGKLISCDAGLHPNWKENDSPSGGYIFSIDVV
jgi:sugar lactone lactonase YvrE